jgi:hypothetical protein
MCPGYDVSTGGEKEKYPTQHLLLCATPDRAVVPLSAAENSRESRRVIFLCSILALYLALCVFFTPGGTPNL